MSRSIPSPGVCLALVAGSVAGLALAVGLRGRRRRQDLETRVARLERDLHATAVGADRRSDHLGERVERLEHLEHAARVERLAARQAEAMGPEATERIDRALAQWTREAAADASPPADPPTDE